MIFRGLDLLDGLADSPGLLLTQFLWKIDFAVIKEGCENGANN